MDTEPYHAVCRDCDWSQETLGKDHAEHFKRVHEHWYDHTVILETPE